MCTRRGFALPLIVVMVLVLGGMLYAVNRVVTSYRHQSTRFRDGEVAYHAARAALEVGERYLEQVLTGSPPPQGPTRELFVLVAFSRPGDLRGTESTLVLPVLDRLLPEGTDGEVTLTVRFPEIEPLGHTVPPGFRVDPLEKRGHLVVEGRARVGAAVRRLEVRRPFRTLYRLPPLIGRFSLLLGSLVGAPEAPNGLTYSPRLGLFQTSGPATLGWPLQIHPLPPTGDGRTPMERWRDDPRGPLARGGWIGLLGETPWILHLTHGAGDSSPLEEGHLLRNFEAVYPSDQLSGVYEKRRRLGFARDVLELPMFHSLRAASIPDTSSLLHLAGDSREPIPPVVLGRVFRRYLTWSKLSADEEGPFTSFHGVDAGDFLAVRPRFESLAPGADYSRYESIMARAVLEPYNRTYDYVVTDDERRDETGRVLAGDSPFTPPRHLLSGDLAPYLIPGTGAPDGFLYPDPAGLDQERAFGGLSIGADDDRVLFEGNPEDILPGLAELLEARAVWRVEDTAEESAPALFRQRFVEDDVLRLGTSVHVRSSRLGLGGLRVEQGGTILVEGDLHVSGPLTTARGEVLALVSLNGDVVIENEEPIAACLVSLRGRIRPCRQGMDVRGQLVAAEFDPLRWMGLRGANRVVYDPRANPARSEARLAQYRIHLGMEREMILERR